MRWETAFPLVSVLLAFVLLPPNAFAAIGRVQTLTARPDRDVTEAVEDEAGVGKDIHLLEKEGKAADVNSRVAAAAAAFKQSRRFRRSTVSDDVDSKRDADSYYCSYPWCNPSRIAKRSRSRFGEITEQKRSFQEAARKRSNSPFFSRRHNWMLLGLKPGSPAARSASRKRSPRPGGWFRKVTRKVSDYCLRHPRICAGATSLIG